MDNKNGKNPLMAISAMMALFTALGIIVYTKAPLKGVRPSIPEIQERSQKIRARLWQDPFQAVLDQAKTKDGAKPAGLCLFKEAILMEIAPLQEEINQHVNEQKKITVLGVMVFGGPYAEEMELRLRQRYAVVSALGRLKFVPQDSEHLGFIRIFPSQKECVEAQNEISLSTILPFEWFVSEGQEEGVLLLWINDDAFREKTIEKLAVLITPLQSQDKKDQLKFKIIGPAGSTTLLEMLKELHHEPKSPILTEGAPSESPGLSAQLKGLEIYSATATAEDSSLLREIKAEPESKLNCQDKSKDLIAKKFCDSGIKFHRTICSDKELAQELVDELELRGVGPRDHIALISEWDTFYGRSLPQTFENARKAKQKEKGQRKEKKNRIHRFSYLRTIDGKLPGEGSGAAKERQKNDGDRNEDKGNLKLEEPTGKSQYDYLRRLAERIYLLDQQLKCEGHGSIKAIGVLGSDFYDKYLVLQALGQRFPERIFFTTDLDARLLHPTYIEWTRNLVVASGFGLQTREDLQGDLPPFRDVYQTSVFLATLQAFNHRPPQLLAGTDAPKPRLFEIGKRNAVDLTQGKAEPNTVHPPRDMPGLQGTSLVVIIFIILLVLALLWFMCISVKNMLKGLGQFISRNPDFALVALIALVGMLYVFNQAILQNTSEEPFSLTEGVSVWPTEILRLLSIGLAWIFIFTSAAKLRKNDHELAEEFCLGNGPDTSAKKPSLSWRRNLQLWWPTRVSQYQKLWEWLGKCAQRISAPGKMVNETSPCDVEKLGKSYQEIRCDWEINSEQGQIRVNQAWKEYLRCRSLSFRLKSVIPLVSIYGLVCVLVIWLFGLPTTPVRGEISRLINYGILFVTIISFLILTFLVFDATSLCRRFVMRFLGKEPQWNLESLEQFRGRVGLAEGELGNWMLIRLIAKRTEVVGNLIFYPFLVWFVIFVSRLRYFDNWRTPIGLAIVLSMSAVLAWSCAFVLRRAAERLRTDILERLAIGAHAAELPSKDHKERLQHLIEEVKSMQRGAFAPYYNNPLVHSLLVPLGGIGGMQLLDIFSKLT
jgi:hypothetical protein